MVSAHDYAQALVLALEHAGPTHADETIARFVAVVRRRGHGRLIPKIVAAFSREAGARERRTRMEVTVADPQVIKSNAKEIAGHAQALGVAPEALAFTVDETLIAGYRLKTRDRIVDASGKRALLELYRRLTAV